MGEGNILENQIAILCTVKFSYFVHVTCKCINEKLFSSLTLSSMIVLETMWSLFTKAIADWFWYIKKTLMTNKILKETFFVIKRNKTN